MDDPLDVAVNVEVSEICFHITYEVSTITIVMDFFMLSIELYLAFNVSIYLYLLCYLQTYGYYLNMMII